MKKVFFSLKLNYPLILGSFIVIMIILVCIYPEYFSPADPYAVQRLQFADIQSASEYITPPVPPGKDYPWGTDTNGRDMRSLIIYGAKATIFMAVTIALLRMLIAIPLGVLMAYKNKPVAWLVGKYDRIFSPFPLVVITLILSRFQLMSDLFQYKSTLIITLLTVLGWSKLTGLIFKRVRQVLEQDFIEGETAIGKTKLEIAVQNILPHIIPTVLILFFLEIASVLLIIAQLGVFGLALDGGYYDTSNTMRNGELSVPVEFDWASLLIFAYLLFGTDEMWLVVFPAAAFAISIIGFNMFGEGLRLELEKRNSRIITWIKSIPVFFSPLRLIYEMRSFKEYRFSVAKKIAAYILILLFIISPSLPSKYDFDTRSAARIAQELSSEQYRGRLIGSEEMQAVTDFIADEVYKYGLMPLNGQYIHAFNNNIDAAKLDILSNEAPFKTLKYMNEFSVNSSRDVEDTLDVTPLNLKDSVNLDSSFEEKYKDKILLLDSRGIDPKKLTLTLMKMAFAYKPKGIMIIENFKSGEEFRLSTNLDKDFNGLVAINVASDIGDQLLKLGDFKIQLQAWNTWDKGAQGYNVLGYIPGSDPQYAKDCIVIGCNLDYKGVSGNSRFSGAIAAEAVAIELELIRNMVKSGIKPKKTIVFAFWDSTNIYLRGSQGFVEQYMETGAKNAYYIDLTNFASSGSKNLILDTSKTIPKSPVSQTYIKIFKKHSRNKAVPVRYEKVFTSVQEDFLGVGKQVLIFGSDGIRTVDDTSDIINTKKLGQYGQVIVDTIIEIASQ